MTTATSRRRSVDRREISRDAKRLVRSLTEETTRAGRPHPPLLKRPGDRAVLRRTLGVPPSDPACRNAHRYVAEYVPEPHQVGDGDLGPTDVAVEWAFYAVAAMMAAQPSSGRDLDLRGSSDRDSGKPPGSFGTTLARAVEEHRIMRDTAAEDRLLLLCRQDLVGLHRQLPRLVMHLRGSRVPIDWVRLVTDLAGWRRDHNHIAKRWLQDYHRTRIRLQLERATKNEQESE